MKNNNIQKLYNKYKLNKTDILYLNNIVIPIYNHPEFQKRLSKEFIHHGEIILGDHIIEDAIMTYNIAKKKKNINIDLAVKIAMFHDLYTCPWQNKTEFIKEKSFFNKHGFRHPIEAVINAVNWYPNEFQNKDDAKVIIDGIIHHMYPLPVTRYYDNKENILELKNFELLSTIPENIKSLIIESTKRKGLKRISICKSKYIEGRIMSKADKKVSIKQFHNFNSIKAIFTGINKSIDRK